MAEDKFGTLVERGDLVDTVHNGDPVQFRVEEVVEPLNNIGIAHIVGTIRISVPSGQVIRVGGPREDVPGLEGGRDGRVAGGEKKSTPRSTHRTHTQHPATS